MIELVVFVVMGGAAIVGALAVIFAKNPVYGALGLLGTLFSLGVFYVMNLAHLVAAVQVIVYAGAVLTLFLFVIMLIGVDKDEDTAESLRFHRPLIGGLAVITLLVGGGLALGGRFDWVPSAAGPETPPNGTVEALAARLFTDWVLAFEVTALLLTIAAAGAIVLAYFRRDGSEPVE
ncbi:MAG TPA: NADH-quinone oxidoreductase subunit J [Acidimicrobiia bacterium]|nr:NADH-quinone oxidoreductase subunit J [Acidimicrobiia bacterium]